MTVGTSAEAASAKENVRASGRWHPRRGETRRPYILSQAVCDRAERLCRVHTQRTVAELLGIEPATLTRLKQRGFRAKTGKLERPRPGDFAIQAGLMSQRELENHYRAGSQTVARWSREVARSPRWRNGMCLPLPDRETVRAAIAGHRTYEDAASALGVSATTLRIWREKHGLMTREADRSLGWVERYVARKVKP